MSGTDLPLPAWQRLLARPRLLHRLATWGILLAALVAGVNTYLRTDPAGIAPGLRLLTLLLDGAAWVVVMLAACAEAFVAGLSRASQRIGSRPHYQIVVGLGVVIIAVLIAAFSSISPIAPDRLGTIGRVVKAAIAGMLPLIAGITLTAGFALLWIYQLRPRIEDRLEARLREYEERGKPTN